MFYKFLSIFICIKKENAYICSLKTFEYDNTTT